LEIIVARQLAGGPDDDGEVKPRRKKKGRANGEGSVFESPKGSKKWIAQISLPDGRFKRARARTQREGLAKLQQMKQELIDAANAATEAAQAPAPTVREVCEHWLATFTMHLKPTVREDYEQELQRYVISSWIADVKVDVLTHSQARPG
jgi:hypothetical protein